MKNTPQEEHSVAQAAAAPARGSRQPIHWTVAVLVIAAAIGVWYWQRPASTGAPAGAPAKGGRFDAGRPLPISAVPARHADLPVRLPALGTVTARNTVTVKSRVDGQLTRVFFREGDRVKAGQLLAQIDPRPFEVALAQAEGQQARDRAQLEAAKVDLARYQGLLATDSIARQQVDTQEALVRQLDAALAVDKAAVDSARLQLSYTRITAPVSGRTGLRQVDPGNLVRASDASGLVVVTEVEPIDVVFPLSQDNLPAVLGRLRSGAALTVDAFDRDGRVRLATGRLMTVDNLIDPATGTVKMKAEFDNRDGALFPNQFVNVRLLLDTLKNAIVVPTSAIQRGAPGTYVYVVRDDSTVTVRKVTLGPADGETTAITDGIAVGERVVSDGADKLREGARVEVIDRNAAPGMTPARAPQEGKAERSGRRRDAVKQ
ncbi:MAG: MdtA/MuxA family multidrug efflux RND transporter periplasmic adaptor subunit [Gemmatimonadota bacterium]